MNDTPTIEDLENEIGSLTESIRIRQHRRQNAQRMLKRLKENADKNIGRIAVRRLVSGRVERVVLVSLICWSSTEDYKGHLLKSDNTRSKARRPYRNLFLGGDSPQAWALETNDQELLFDLSLSPEITLDVIG